MLLDDLHWCDRETLDWLRYLMEYQMQDPLSWECEVRTEDLSPENPGYAPLLNWGKGAR